MQKIPTLPKNFLLFFLFVAFLMAWPLAVQAQTVMDASSSNVLFFEAENFILQRPGQRPGWKVVEGAPAKRASQLKALTAAGSASGVAVQAVDIPVAGTWRVWVRYSVNTTQRGPFKVEILSGEKVVASHIFDVEVKRGVEKGEFVWDSFDASLPVGSYSLCLSKEKEPRALRTIDCFLLTSDLQQKPDYTAFGPQTWMKVTLGDGYARPVQIHIFADHFRSPWYGHYAVSKDGVEDGLRPKRKEALLVNGETTGWVNISRMIYQDSGARLLIYPAYSYGDNASRFNAVVEFANQPKDSAVVRKFDVRYSPSTFHVVMPPNLETKENIAKLRSDADFAAEYGAIADQFEWPQKGKKPVAFPFFVATGLEPGTVDAGVVARELKTLSYFGFNGIDNESAYAAYGFSHKYIGGVGWYMKGSYSAPDREKMQGKADAVYKAQVASGIKPEEIDLAMVMDEPTGEPLSKLASDTASIAGFQDWLKSKNLTPEELLVTSWSEVKPVLETDRERYPALYYYSQQYRTIALGRFLEIQKQLLQERWKRNFPVVANFSDGAVYHGNFTSQGVDYFTLLHDTDQNAIWSEDWSNGSSTYQNATYNVELMRAAARRNGQTMGQHLIVYAGRKGYDIRLKAVSEVARGVKMFKSYSYGPVWSQHEPSAWQKNTSLWADQAAVVREIGAVEEYLLPAMPQKARVAILYSSASDIWNRSNLAYGFERMHTWLALTHAQIPVDIVGEGDAAKSGLEGYKVCYLADPNITREAALKLRDWVRAGGTLVMTAGAGARDEFNRPLDVLSGLLPYRRMPVENLQNFTASGAYLRILQAKDTVDAGQIQSNVLSVKQVFEVQGAGNGLEVKSKFSNGSPAEIRSASGKGFIVCRGYLPALDYIQKALLANAEVKALSQNLNENNGIPGPDDILPLELNKKSSNPWQYPAEIRQIIINPVTQARLDLPLRCNVPLVDAVYMTSPRGIVIPLANYTLQPVADMTLEIRVDKPFQEVRSVYQGKLNYEKIDEHKIRVRLPLECSDFLMIAYK